MATISVQREYGVALLRRMKVVVDGQPAGWVRNDSTLDVEVRAGPHAVQVRMDWQRSATVTVMLHEDQRVVLRARMDFRSQGMTGVLLRPREALDLDVVEQSSPGG